MSNVSATSDNAAAVAVLHDAAWFASRIGVRAEWVQRHRRDIPHFHKVGAFTKYGECCVDDFLEGTKVTPTAVRDVDESSAVVIAGPGDPLRPTSRSQARRKGARS